MAYARRHLLAGAAAALAAGSFARLASAQTFTKPVRCIVPYAAGGNVDVTARLIADPMSRVLGQTVVVENRAGGGGVVGAEATIQLPADGHTFVIGALGTFYIAALMAGKPDMMPHFTPVSLLSSVPMVIVVPPNSRFADWRAVLAEARTKPGTISIGHAGNGTSNHIDILRIQLADKVQFNIVPYRGSGQGLIDVIAGQIDVYVDQLTSSLPHIRTGKLKPLAFICPQRVKALPEVPTLKELGGPDFDGGTTLGIFVRVQTPKPYIPALNAAVVAALKDAIVVQRLTDLGATPLPSTPEEYAAHLKTEEAAVSELAKLGLLKPEG